MQQVCRTPTPLIPLLFAFQAVLVLAGFGGPAGSWLIMGIGLCAVHLGSAAYTAWRQRPSMVRVV
jgi:hypothetical protein